jgi:hypothetical protein
MTDSIITTKPGGTFAVEQTDDMDMLLSLRLTIPKEQNELAPGSVNIRTTLAVRQDLTVNAQHMAIAVARKALNDFEVSLRGGEGATADKAVKA